MSMREIDKSEWPGFCAAFSRQHQGWLVGITETALAGEAGGGAVKEGTVLAQDVPLEGLSTGGDGRGEHLVITVGQGDDRVTHTVLGPRRLLLEQTADDADQGLRIDSARGVATFLRFRTAAHPDALDGLAESER
jgi:hypothetical protein